MLRALATTSLLFLLCLAPAGSAQGTTPFFRLDVTVDQSTKEINKAVPDAQVSFNVTFKVTPQQETPLSSQFTIRIHFEVRFDQGQNGWTASNVSGTNDFTLQPNQARTIPIEVSNTIDRPEGDSLQVKLNATSRPVCPTCPSDPISQSVIGTMGQADNKNVEFTATRHLKTSEAVTSFVKTNRWYLLAAAGGIFVLVVVFARKKKGAVTAICEQPVQEVLPGRGASFPIQVRNEGSTKEPVALATSDLPEGWQAILPLDQVELGPKESSTVWLTLKAPARAKPGEHVQTSFVASTGAGTTSEVLLEAIVVERYGQGGPPPAPQEAPAVAVKKPRRS